MKGNQTLSFELMTLTSHLEVATPTDCAVGAGKRVGAHDLWWARCQVREYAFVACVETSQRQCMHQEVGDQWSAGGRAWQHRVRVASHTMAHARGILACALAD